MKYIRLFLRGYKPLLYGGTKQIDLHDMGQIVILSGENGKGKSSILRELTPYPATRTDYEKNGLKVIEIEHRGVYYTLTSDFSKSGAHSFKRGDDELNISGTTEVQNDLVLQYFEEFTPLVEKLMSGQCKFSSMSRNDRKQVIMATYPSSLLFLLTKYKNLMTKIRTLTNQMKLLNERKLKLNESLIGDDVLKAHRETQTILNNDINTIDKQIYALEQQIKPYLASERYHQSFDYTADDIKSACLSICREFKELCKSYKPENVNGLDAECVRLNCEIDYIESELESSDKTAVNLRSEIDKFKDYLETDQHALITECEQEIKTQNDIIQSYTIDDDTPTVDIDQADYLRSVSSAFKTQLDELTGIGVPLYTEEEYYQVENTIHHIEADIRTNDIQLHNLEMQLQKEYTKLERYRKHDYPETCKIHCNLRESLEEIIHTTEIEIGRLNESCTALKKASSDLNKSKTDYETQLRLRTNTLPIIRRFEHLLTGSSWGSYVCGNKSFVQQCNTNPIDIWNRLTKVIKKSESHHKVLKAKERLQYLTDRLTTLKSESIPAKQILSQSVMEKELMLKSLTEKREHLMQRIKKLHSDVEHYSTHQHLCTRINTLVTKWSELSEHLQLHAIVDDVHNEIDRLLNIKNQLSERLRELDGIVHEQESLRARLHDEIEPLSNDISAQLYRFDLIEKQLSPTSGLPHKNIVRYINALFQKANAFIKQVWNYDMELEYLNESDDCDYTFRVIINMDGIVKDINLCSKGQKEIIDLAIILAISTYRKYALEFPVKLDEMSSGLSPDHSDKLFSFLSDLFHQSTILQAFIVNHDPIVTSGFADAGYAVLSEDYPLPASCRVITKIN